MQKSLKVERGSWQRAKVCAAESGVSLKAFVEGAIKLACTRHEQLKRRVVETTPVTFLEGTEHGR